MALAPRSQREQNYTTAGIILAGPDGQKQRQHQGRSFFGPSKAQMWTLLAVGAIVSIGFAVAAVVLMWIDFRPLTDKERL